MLPFFRGIFVAASWVAVTAIPVSVQAASEMPENVQAMSFKVSINGREVMAPILGMPTAGRAEVSIGASERDGYTLGINVMKADQSTELLPLKLRLELWRGSSHNGKLMLDRVMEVTAHDPTSAPRSVEAVYGWGGVREHIQIKLVALGTRRAGDWQNP